MGCAKWQPLGLLLLIPILALGCSNEGGYRLRGKISLAEKPVPAGEILFAPDTSKGNSGPGLLVEIKEGRYQTRAGKGHVGGCYVLTITGFDGNSAPEKMMPKGDALFSNYKLEVELPHENSELDIDVPSK